MSKFTDFFGFGGAEEKPEVKKEQVKPKAAQPQVKDLYSERKKELLNAFSDFIASPEDLNKILTPLAEKVEGGVKDTTSIGVLDVFSSAASAVSFAAKNAGSIYDLVKNKGFYQAEASKIIKGRGDKNDMSFFLKLLEDPDFLIFLKDKKDNLGKLFETIAPTVISIAFRELGNVANIEEKLKLAKEKNGPLASLEAELETLKKVKAPSKEEKNRGKELKDKINEITLLEQRLDMAKIISHLEPLAINSKYIEKQILPLAIDPIKQILSQPDRIIKTAGSAVDAVFSRSEKKTTSALLDIAENINVNLILKNNGLKKFLETQNENLIKIATVAINDSRLLKAATEKYGISPGFIAKVIPVATKIPAAALSNTENLSQIYGSFINFAKADKEHKNDALQKLINSGTAVLLQDEVLNSVKGGVREIVKENQKELNDIITHNLAKLDDKSLPKQILAGVDNQFVTKAVSAAGNLVTTVLAEVSNDQIRGLAQMGTQLLAAKKEERAKVMENIAGQAIGILKNDNFAKSIAGVGELISTQKDQLGLIANNLINTEPVKAQLKEFGVPSKLANDVVGMVTEVVPAVLADSKKLAAIYDSFNEFSKADKENKPQQLSKLIGSATTLILQEEVLNSVKGGISNIVKENQADLANIVAHNLAKLDENSLPRKLLNGVNAELTTKTIGAVSNLVTSVLTAIPNDQIRGLAHTGQQFLTAKKEERADIVRNVAGQAAEFLKKDNVVKSIAGVGELISTQKDQLGLIANNLINTEPVKAQLKEFGVSSKLANDVVGMVTEVVPAVLADSKKFTEIYNSFNEFSKADKENKPQQLSKLIGSATTLILQEQLLTPMKGGITKILSENQAGLVNIVNHNLAKLDENSLPRKLLAGVDSQFVNKTVNTVSNLATSMLAEVSKDQIEGLARTGQQFLTAKKDERADIVRNVASQAAEFLKKDNVVKSIAGVGELISTQKDQLGLLANNLISTEPVKAQLKEFGVPPKLANDVVGMVTKVVPAVLADSKKFAAIYDSFNEFSKADKANKPQQLSKLIGSATTLILQEEVLNSVKGGISNIVKENQAGLVNIVNHNLAKLDENSLPRKLLAGVDAQFVNNTINTVSNLATTMLAEVSNDQIKGFVKTGTQLLTARKENRAGIALEGARELGNILASPAVAQSLSNVGQTLTSSNSEIAKIANNFISENTELKETIKRFGITTNQIQDGLSLAIKPIAMVLNNTKEIVDIVNTSEKLIDSFGKNKGSLAPSQAEAIGKIIVGLENIITRDIKGPSEQPKSKGLTELLTENKQQISVIAGNIVQNTPVLKAIVTKLEIPDKLIKDTATLGTDIIIDVVPVLDKMAKATLSEKNKLITIISGAQDLINAPNDKRKEPLLKLVSNVIALKNENPELKNVFDKEIPDILMKNQKQISEVVNSFIKTQVGKDINLKTEKIIQIAAENLPTLSKIADLYSKGQYGAVALEGVKLIFKKDVLSTVIGTVTKLNKYKNDFNLANLKDAVTSTIKNDVTIENTTPYHMEAKKIAGNIEKKLIQTKSTESPAQTSKIEDIKDKVEAHVSDKKQTATVISKEKKEELKNANLKSNS